MCVQVFVATIKLLGDFQEFTVNDIYFFFHFS